MSKVAIIGSGNVGIGVLDALVLLDIGREIVLYNRNLGKALGEVYDVSDAVPLLSGSQSINATQRLEDLHDAEIIVITSGAKQEVGESRLDLIEKNRVIIIELIEALDRINPNAIIIVVTNPVDIMTRIAIEHSKRPQERLFGSGTVLDTLRLREELGIRLGINRKNIHAFVVGEHGDSEFVLWSVATVGPILLENFGIENLEMLKTEVEEKVRRRAYSIIEKKGFTKQAIGVAVAKLIKAILGDEKRIFTLSTPLSKRCAKLQSDVVLSQPCILGKEGIERVLMLDCNIEEFDALKHSIAVLNEAYMNIYKTK